MRSNPTKKEIDLVSTEDLNIRYCYILDRAEKSKAEDIPVSDAREILWIEDVLHSRLIKKLDRDPYPPDRIEKQAPSNYMKSLLKSRQDKPEEKTDGKFSFKIIITSSIGSVVTQKNVKVNSMNDADLAAQNLIKLLGLKRATYKIT
jgi:hypothetical protein